MSIHHFAGIGHPWTAEPGWDQLMMSADSDSALDRLVAEAEQKFWKIWYRTAGMGPNNINAQPRVHMFKPSGRTADWQDISWQGTPRGHGHQFKVGDEVYTDFDHNRISYHKVVAIEERKISQTGIMLRVTPPPRGSSYVSDDPGRGPAARDAKTALLDAAWFRKVA